MKKIRIVFICFALLLTFTGSAVLANAGAAEGTDLQIAETVQENIHKKEIKNIRKYMKNSKKNKNSKKYIEMLAEEYDVEEESLNNAEEMIIQDEYIAISPMVNLGREDVFFPDLPGGGGGTPPVTSEKISEFGYLKFTTVCTKLGENTPSGYPIWQIECTATSLGNFALKFNDSFAISHSYDALTYRNYSAFQKKVYYKISDTNIITDDGDDLSTSHYGYGMRFAVNKLVTIQTGFGPHSYYEHFEKVKLTYYIEQKNSITVFSKYMHYVNPLGINTSVTIGPFSITPEGSFIDEFEGTSVYLPYNN